MSKTVINLTQHSILQEIERVLEGYPDHPYQQAFAHPDTRQELLVWVLNRIPNNFTTLELTESAIADSAYVPYKNDDKSCTEVVIQQGIQEVLNQKQPLIGRYLPEEEDARLAPSHWFG